MNNQYYKSLWAVFAGLFISVSCAYEGGMKRSCDELDVALQEHSCNGHTRGVKDSLEKGAHPNAYCKEHPYTALMQAVYRAKLDVVKCLLDNEKVDVNQQDAEGDTALLVAAKVVQPEIIDLLLAQKGIKVDVVNGSGDNALTALFQPLSNFKEGNNMSNLLNVTNMDIKSEIAVKLLERDIPPNHQNGEGKTVAMLVVDFDKKSSKCLKTLLDTGKIWHSAQTSRKTPNIEVGTTLLMYAVSAGHVEAVRLLLDHYKISSVMLRNKQGKTAFQQLLEKKNDLTEDHVTIAQMLISVMDKKEIAGHLSYAKDLNRGVIQSTLKTLTTLFRSQKGRTKFKKNSTKRQRTKPRNQKHRRLLSGGISEEVSRTPKKKAKSSTTTQTVIRSSDDSYRRKKKPKKNFLQKMNSLASIVSTSVRGSRGKPESVVDELTPFHQIITLLEHPTDAE